MKRLILLALSTTLLACTPAGPDPVRRVTRSEVSIYHDDERGVTCWCKGYSISCLPDSAFSVPR